MSNRSDEEYARQLLEAHLRRHRDSSAICRFNEPDPPDLVCHVGGFSWAVEVTQVHQRFVESGKAVPHKARTARLERFGKMLEQELGPSLKMRYVLYLEGPLSTGCWRTWQRTISDGVRSYIHSGATKRMEFSGASIWAFPGEGRVSLMLGIPFDSTTPDGAMNQDIAANLSAMFSHALSDKARKLEYVAGFDAIALVLVNTYPLADDIAYVRSCLAAVVQSDPRLSIFDRIYFASNNVIHLIHPHAE
ncbi:MAG: hypothetical protein QF582_07970 [Alphaproteobacteria bacterium]|jgi:hypothetical protein|nr:hypothetical protein [Alphaproteobacteria bacterium]|tara:strand:+ start:281 stop:1024 length:744 start_codon:yes stop_codon:yes gene_type:complete